MQLTGRRFAARAVSQTRDICALLLLMVVGHLLLKGQDKANVIANVIDFTQRLVSVDGKPMPNGDTKPPADLLLGDVAVVALESMIEDDKQLSGADKFKRDELARKVYRAKAAVLTLEELALIKERIGKVYAPAVVGAAWRLLDPAEAAKTAKTKEGSK